MNTPNSTPNAPLRANDVVDSAERALDGERASLGEVIDAIGYASYTPLLMVPALALVSPLSGVPGFSADCGILIASVSAQMMLNRQTLWLPQWLRRRSMSAHRVQQVMKWFRVPARWLDTFTRQRLGALVSTPFSILPQAVCFSLGAIIPLLELVPFSSSAAGAVIVVLAAPERCQPPALFGAAGCLSSILGVFGRVFDCAPGAFDVLACALNGLTGSERPDHRQCDHGQKGNEFQCHQSLRSLLHRLNAAIGLKFLRISARKVTRRSCEYQARRAGR